ncbi:MAG TPA: PD-(D/E)XK nuclease family protein [Pirellulales bacterium]|nr:PD-(D/E)XK nuclease family protein [Pirellulales bacterium]
MTNQHRGPTFLGWSRPALEQAALWLLDRYAVAGTLDLTGIIVVVPGARAGRRLLEVVVEHAEQSRLALAPPQIVTVGHLPEKLYEPAGRFADRLSCQLALLRALEETDAALLRRIAPELPDRNDPARWLGLVDLVGRLHAELTGHGLTFAEVERAIRSPENQDSRLTGASEAGRWETLAAVQESYAHRLKQIGLVDVQLARLDAIRRNACRCANEIVLVGVADLMPAVEKLLEQVADRVTALVFAPTELADRFTRFGAIAVGAWKQAHLDLDEERMVVVEGPAEQATAVIDTLAGFEGQYAADEITIGVPDTSIVPFLERRLDQFGLPSRYGEALCVRQTAPYRLLAAVADYVDGERFTDFAALVRHPDLETWLVGEAGGDQTAGGDWLAALDSWYGQHLQVRLSTPSSERGAATAQVADLQAKVDRLVKPFHGQRSLAEWAREMVALLVSIYGSAPLDGNQTRGRVLLAACEAIHGVLREAFAADAKLSGRWQAADAIRLVLRQIEDEPVPPPAGQPAIELLGWLELPLDDAPALVVTGFNDGIVPSFINSDPFLPNALRRQLGLVDNDHRYARDCYALATLVGSRRELRLIAGRRSAEGDPLTPSRLAFACPPERIARRVLGYFGVSASPDGMDRVPHGLPAGQAKSRFEPPKPRRLAAPITSLRVTQFRDYLACPYRFYLRHVLRLAALNDLAEELDPQAFGSLAHDVLKVFGEDPANSRLTDPERIRSLLDSALDRLITGRFGKERLPAVEVQIEHLRLRLAAFARWQAGWSAQGWRIVKTEVEVPDGAAPFSVDGKPMYLKARIDRIDRHAGDGRYLIFDYKTSDRGDSPEKTHRRKNGEWIDLQLPLYRHLTRIVEIESAAVGLGYILLPKALTAVKDELATWGPADLASADEAAAEVVRAIRTERFWPPTTPGPSFDDFAAICLEQQRRGYANAEGEIEEVPQL